jgi:hypothetical protein
MRSSPYVLNKILHLSCVPSNGTDCFARSRAAVRIAAVQISKRPGRKSKWCLNFERDIRRLMRISNPYHKSDVSTEKLLRKEAQRVPR